MDRWNGLYLKASKDRVAEALTHLAQARGYRVLANERVDIHTLETFVKSGLLRRDFGTLEVIFLFDANEQWIRMVGLEYVDACQPQLIFPSELIALIGCDAFECGYMGLYAWWYTYFEQGHVCDRFDSNPTETVMGHFEPLDLSDPRAVYLQCTGLKRDQRITWPDQVLAHFHGRPQKLIPILKHHNYRTVEVAIRHKEMRPMEAIGLLGAALTLPYIGEFWLQSFLQDLAQVALTDRGVSASELIQLAKLDMAMLVFRHPKSGILI